MPTASQALRRVSEYHGQQTIRVACTQLSGYTAREAKRVLDEWVEFLGSPSQLTDLEFATRTPKRLFAALAGQPQLVRLAVKWGDYSDLSPLSSMAGLHHLSLRGASAVSDVAALSSLTELESLTIEGFRTIADTTPLSGLLQLRDLELGGAWTGPRNGHLGSIRVLRHLVNLQDVLLHTVVVDDLDYSPLLDLPRLRSVRVMKVRGMQPDHEELRKALPWSG